MYLEKIQSPEDVKKLDVEQLKVLAGEMRQALIQKLSVHGGHVRSEERRVGKEGRSRRTCRSEPWYG